MIDLTILKDLSSQLNEHDVTWGIGGSCLLMLYNLYSAPNDLDLWVQPDDIAKVREIFAAYEEIPTDIPLPKELHFKMLFHNVEVDFVACFIIKPNQHQYRFDICPENIRMITIGDMQVPCTYLEDWFIIYHLLNRTGKAKLIQDYFTKHQVEFDESALMRAVQHKNVTLPSRLDQDIDLLVFGATQLSFPLPASEIEVPAEYDHFSKKDSLRIHDRQNIPFLLFEATQLSFPLFDDEESITCVQD